MDRLFSQMWLVTLLDLSCVNLRSVSAVLIYSVLCFGVADDTITVLILAFNCQKTAHVCIKHLIQVQPIFATVRPIPSTHHFILMQASDNRN